MDKKTIIVTGGAGFIGSNFIYYMLKKYPNYRIVCFDLCGEFIYSEAGNGEGKFSFCEGRHS